jgi:predicted permease
MDTLLQDIRFAFRNLRKTPGFTAVAVLTLALGIGANTSVFTLVNAALYHTIAAPHPEELVWIAGTHEAGPRQPEARINRNISFPEFRDYRDRLSSLRSIAAYQDVALALGSGGEPARVTGLIASSRYFEVLQMRPTAGRFFMPEDDQPGATPVAIISHSLWQGRFGGALDLVGRDITVNGRPFVLIGIAPEGFAGIELGSSVDMWVTFATIAITMPGNERLIEDRGAGWLRMIGRLKNGIQVDAANAEAQTIAAQIVAAYPRVTGGDEAFGIRVVPLEGGLEPSNQAQARPVMLLLMAVPFVVLLIACANVANLMLARAAARRREIGIRLAIGATRRRLVSQLLVEALVVAVLAGGAALLIAFWLNDALIAISQIPASVAQALRPDWRVFAFTGLIAIATGVLFGLAPAWNATRPDLIPALKDEGLGLGRHLRRSRLVSVFVVAQVAMSLVLLVTAGLFLRTLGKALRVDPGVDIHNTVALSFDLRLQGYDDARQGAFYTTLLERVRALPGVTAASLASPRPLSERMISSAVVPEGWDPNGSSYNMGYAMTWPGYFAAAGTPLLRGRDFTTHDVKGAPLVAIINETLARRLWPDQDPIGKRLRFPWRDEPLREVVGVAQDGKYHELTEQPRGYIYLPERQRADLTDISLLVRSAGDPRPLIPVLSEALHALDRNLPVFQIVTLEDALRDRLDKERGAAAVLGVFGGLALLLASLGLYGVMAYAVAQRTREVGVRMALGAQSGLVLRQFVFEGVRFALVGVAIGLALAAGVTRVASRFLYGVEATDLLTFMLCAVVLTAVAAAASFLPAQRAARVDPMIALRSE